MRTKYLSSTVPLSAAHNKALLSFKREVLSLYRRHGRHRLPWRIDQSPYRVFISEIMLQQTGVARVLPKFETFIAAFPSFETLARANLRQVYALWQGLGYNRRAKYLRDAAKRVVEEYGGVLPKNVEALKSLPGIGPYTAGAIAAFSFGNPEPFVETNIRTAVMHHFFPDTTAVSDTEILAVLVRLRPARGREARHWYAALMDYGADLKRQGLRINHKSAQYVKQSKFEDSLRQVRGAVLRVLGMGGRTLETLAMECRKNVTETNKALRGLCAEGLVRKRGRIFFLAD
jgi:A/G-specific adenine glycosylase